jgi:teichuronic acid exporter
MVTDDNLKKKTIAGLFWGFTDSIANQGLLFIIGIILARLLSPKEFGLVGMITVFIAVSESLINSGFSQALIRKKECTNTDLSTVFYFNLVVGILIFGILILSAPVISRFFEEPQLVNLIRILSIVLIIDALTMIQRTTLIKRIDFKLQAKVSVISTIFSGVVGITMAYTGFGVWSLVAKKLSQQAMNSMLLWFWNHWRPLLIFSRKSFLELFSFGSKLLVSGLIDTLYNNLYYIIIGKYFSAVELGYYTRADQFKDLPSKNINGIISKVSYPVLVQLHDDPEKLKAAYKRIIKSTMFVTFILMAVLAAVAEPIIITLIGEKWQPAIIYLQLLCFVGAMYPLHALNLNMLNVQGRSDLFLRLEIVKKIMAVPIIISGVIWGMKILIIGMWLNSLIAYYLNSYYSGRLINYAIREQLADIVPSILFSLFIGIIVLITGWILPAGYLTKLITQLLVSVILIFSISELFRVESYLYIKEIVKTKLISAYNARK